MSKLRISGLAVSAAFFLTPLSGCGVVTQATMTEEDVHTLSAEKFAAQPEEVKISKIKKSFNYNKWRVEYKGVLYDCFYLANQLVEGEVGCNPVMGQEGHSKSTKSDSLPPSSVMEVQKILNAKGYDAGPVDGVAGGRTNKALAAYQIDMGYTLTNGITEEAYKQLTSK